MPTYVYILRETGERIERTMTVAEQSALPREFDGGYRLPEGVADRDFAAEHKRLPATSAWPILCDASGVHPSQVNAAADHARQCGVPTDFTPDGRAVLRDSNHRRKYLKSIGLIDRASYG